MHRLLGWRPDSRSRFRHDPTNRLPYDVVVVDEPSMISLTMMARLLDAVRPTARLVLVGDPDQLTLVDAGAVLSDLVHRPAAPATSDGVPPSAADDGTDLDGDERRQLRNGVVRLRISHRYGADIAGLAEAIRTGDAECVLDLLAAADALAFDADTVALEAQTRAVAEELGAAAEAGDAALCLRLLGRH